MVQSFHTASRMQFKPDEVACTCSRSMWKAEAGGWFRASLGYTVNLSPVWTTYLDPVSKQSKTKQQQKKNKPKQKNQICRSMALGHS